jgi:hypothetical protein
MFVVGSRLNRESLVLEELPNDASFDGASKKDEEGM